MKLKSPFVVLIFSFLVFSSCQKDNSTENDSWVQIINPGFPSTNVQANNVRLLVVYSLNTGRLFEVRAKIFPRNNRSNIVYNLKQKTDDSKYTISEVLDLSSFPSGTQFTMIAESDQNKKGTLVAKDSVNFIVF